MKFTITKTWAKVPFTAFTIQAPHLIKVRMDSGETAPTGNGQPFSGQKIEKFTESAVWVKLDNEKFDSIEVEIANFI